MGMVAIVTPFQFTLGSPRLGKSKHRAGVAQLVERKALNLVVKGSSPFFGDITVCFDLYTVHPSDRDV